MKKYKKFRDIPNDVTVTSQSRSFFTSFNNHAENSRFLWFLSQNRARSWTPTYKIKYRFTSLYINQEEKGTGLAENTDFPILDKMQQL